MCTAICYRSNSSYFGRNLDLDRGYGEGVVITPRNCEIKMRCEKPIKSHYAMIGMATVVEDYPLYYEATNEMGLSMAGLNFPENAVYCHFAEEKDNVAPFELIPWILAQCAYIGEAKALLENHGVVLGADSLERAYMMFEALDYAARTGIAAMNGTIVPISPEEIREIEIAFNL